MAAGLPACVVGGGGAGQEPVRPFVLGRADQRFYPGVRQLVKTHRDPADVSVVLPA